MERKKNKIDLRKLDLFIQKSLDLYFYVDPWKKLYERTGRIHRNVISDKSTIPDLIIYNKQFNKSECFYETNNSKYVKYPRIRFILRPKFRKEYNPTETYGKEEEVYYIKGKDLHENKDSSSADEYVSEQKEEYLNKEELFLNQNDHDLDNEGPPSSKENKKALQNEYQKEDKDEEEPEWANDNVEDFYNTKIEFKSIPKSIEDKMEEEYNLEKNEIGAENLNKNEDKNNIDIDNFFRSNSDNSLNEIRNKNKGDDNKSINSNNSNNGNDMIFKDLKDFMKNQIDDNEKDNPDSTNENNENGNSSLKDSEKSDGLNENFSVFEKLNNIFIDDKKNFNKTNKEPQSENKIIENLNNRNNQFFNNKINNIENNSINRIDYDEILKNNLIMQQQKAKQQYLKMIQMQNINNQFNNPNIINQSPYIYYNNPQFSNNIPYCNNPNLIQNNTNYGNINTINFHDKSNALNPGTNFYSFNNIIPGINMPNMNLNNINRGNQYFIDQCVNNVNNSKDMYVNSLNRMIFNANNYNNNFAYPAGKLEVYKNRWNNINYSNLNMNNINKVNYLNSHKNIFTQNLKKTENNNFSNNMSINNSRVTSNLINEQLKSKIELKNEKEKENEIVNPADYLENPTLIFKKNLEKKNWLVINKEGNIVHNFNSNELFKFLDDKNKKDDSLEEFTINDFDTDVVFPAKFLYGNLKNFYSH